jgi:hypothetical protein
MTIKLVWIKDKHKTNIFTFSSIMFYEIELFLQFILIFIELFNPVLLATFPHKEADEGPFN